MMSTASALVPPSYRGIIKLAAPVVVSMLSLTLMGIVDTLIVGRLGTAQLAAVGFAVMLGFSLFSFAIGFMGGVTTIVSQNFGARNFSACRAVVGQALLASLGFGVLYGLLSFLVEDLLRLFQLSNEVQHFGARYGRWYLAGGLFVVCNQAMVGFFQGIGNTKIPMWIAIVANVVNAALAWVLVLGWNGFGGYGVVGAAFATILANVLSLILYGWCFRQNSLGRGKTEKRPYLDWVLLKRLSTLGFPIGTQMFLGIASFLIFYLFVAWLGDASLAATRIVIQMDHLGFMPIVGIGQAAQVIVGQYVGARKPVIAKQMVNKAILLGLLLETTVGLVYLLFADPIVRLFSEDPTVILLGTQVLRIALSWMAFDAVFLISLCALRGVGDVRWPMAVTLVVGYGVRLPLVYLLIFPLGYGFFGAWIGLIIAFLLLGVLLYGRFARGRWMKHYEVGPLVQEIPSPLAMA